MLCAKIALPVPICWPKFGFGVLVNPYGQNGAVGVGRIARFRRISRYSVDGAAFVPKIT